MYRIPLIVLLVTLATPAFAATLSLSELPYGFLQGVIQGDIIVFSDDENNIHSQFETDGFAAYPYLTESVVHFLLQYDVASGSRCCGGTPGEVGGSLFLGVAQAYDLSTNGHEVDIYLDRLTPDNVGQYAFHSNQPQTTVLMDGSAIAANRGLYMIDGDPYYNESGNMNFGPGFGAGNPNYPFICVECRLFFALNLVYLDYSSGLMVFNPDDPRAVVIDAYDSFYTTPYGFSMYLTTRSVPLPGALFLLATAVAGLGLTRRRTI